MPILNLPRLPLFLAYLTVLLPTTATAQGIFCSEALSRVPYTETTAVTFDDVTYRIWRQSLNQTFSTYSDFERWSQTRDESASYQLFSLSYGDLSERSSGSFSEDYTRYSTSFESTLLEYRFHSEAERYPIAPYINRVLDQCIRGPLFAAIKPGPHLTTFTLALKATPPNSATPIDISFTSAECRDMDGQYKRSIFTIGSLNIVECRRTDADQESIIISTEFASAWVKMPTVSSQIGALERKLAHQHAILFKLAERLSELEERMALAANNTWNSTQGVTFSPYSQGSLLPGIRATASVDSSFFSKADQSATSLPESLSDCGAMQSCPSSGLMSTANSSTDLENKFELQFEVFLPQDAAEMLERELLEAERGRTVPVKSNISEPVDLVRERQ